MMACAMMASAVGSSAMMAVAHLFGTDAALAWARYWRPSTAALEAKDWRFLCATIHKCIDHSELKRMSRKILLFDRATLDHMFVVC